LASIDIKTDKALYASGDTISVGIELTNPSAAVRVGIYAWLETPGGDTAWILTLPDVLLPDGFSYSNETLLTAMLPPLPRGDYACHASILKVPENEIIGSSTSQWTFGQAVQSDWSTGPDLAGPFDLLGEGFETSTGVAWRSVQGRLSLSAEPRATPIKHVIAPNAGKPNSVGTGDLNGDGKIDVLTTDPVYDIYNDLGAIYWYELLPVGSWAQRTVSDDFYGAKYVDTADVDSDGDTDVIAAAYYGDAPGLGRNGKYVWFENANGTGLSWRQGLVGDWFWGASHISAGDLDGDGDIDLAGASQLTDGIDEQEADLVWFENLDGTGDTWAQHDLDLDFPNASEAHIVDLDGDNDLDVVGTFSDEYGPSNFYWWENVHGDGTVWNKRLIPGEFWGSGYVDVGDIDGDGDIDLLGSGYNTSTVGFWENLDGTGTSWQAWSVVANPGGRGAELVDMEGDGDLDALLWNTYWVMWVENTTGTGYHWNPHLLTNTVDRPWAKAADVDNDGKLDVAVSREDINGTNVDQVSFFDLSLFESAGELTSSVLDGHQTPDWGLISWEAEVPSDTFLGVEVRVTDDLMQWGDFKQVPHSGYDLKSLIDPYARYFQYRVQIATGIPTDSPVLHVIEVEKGSGL